VSDAQPRPARQRLVSTVLVQYRGAHAHLTVRVRGASSGTLVVSKVDAPLLIARLFGEESRNILAELLGHTSALLAGDSVELASS
jgi:hypothetical protein